MIPGFMQLPPLLALQTTVPLEPLEPHPARWQYEDEREDEP